MGVEALTFAERPVFEMPADEAADWEALRHDNFEADQPDAVEAVTASYEDNMAARDEARTGKVNKYLRNGAAVFAASLAFGAPETAQATTTSGTPEVTVTKTTMQFNVAGSKMSEKSLAQATVVEDYRVISKARIRELEKQGKCMVIDGRKTKIWTQGHTEAGHPYGRDTRTSEFCHTDSQVRGKDGRMQTIKHWYRALCGNRAVLTPPKQIVQHPFWVKTFNNLKMKLTAKSHAKAEAECKTDNTSAKAFAEGSGAASLSIRIRNSFKAHGVKEVISRLKAKAEARAASKSSAKAVAKCAEVKTETTTTTEQPPHKDGTQGAGEGTPGNTNTGSTVGGQGAGGEAGNSSSSESVPCYDDDSTANGDQNPATQGDTMYGSQADQFGYCVGPAKPATNA